MGIVGAESLVKRWNEGGVVTRFVCLLGLIFLGCSQGLQAIEEEARGAVQAGQFGQAMETARKGLQTPEAANDPAASWRLELVILESMARSGQGAIVARDLDAKKKEYPTQVNAKLVLTLGSYARDAGDTKGAIDMWVAGDTLFPESTALFKASITELQSAGTLAPAELEKLKSLGYIQ
jgi:hypothetical protein